MAADVRNRTDGNQVKKALKTVEQLTAQGRELLREHDPTAADSNFGYWDEAVAQWLDENCPGTGLSAEWSSLGSSPMVIGGGYHDDDSTWLVFRKIVLTRLQWLSRVPKTLNYAARSREAEKARRTVASDKVFVVHGRDETAREKVARFLEKIRLRPVILHEQANQGRTIIEKFVDYSDVAFAVVLLTPDDVGGLAADGTPQKPRARQNVLFELGYFLGQLGKARVCALHQGEIEIPSDYSGVLLVPMDAVGGWKLQLAKEMKAAGLPVDMNDVI